MKSGKESKVKENAGRGDLFEGLSVWENENYREFQGTYPVISLSFANVKEIKYEDTRYRICQILMNLYAEMRFLLEGDLLTPKEKEYFGRISENMREQDATMSLHYLSSFLYRYYGELVGNDEGIWSLPLASGYLKVLRYDEDLTGEEEPTYELCLTNLEVKRMVRAMVKGWFNGSRREYNEFSLHFVGRRY